MAEKSWEMEVLRNHSFSCICRKKGKMWMRVGNIFTRCLLKKFARLRWIWRHNPLSTKSRPDANFRRAGFLFLLLNALQLLLLKLEAWLVFWRQSLSLFPHWPHTATVNLLMQNQHLWYKHHLLLQIGTNPQICNKIAIWVVNID